MTTPQETPIEARRHELFTDIAEQAAKRLIEKHGVDMEAAVDVGNDLADFLGKHWKGQQLYIPADEAFKLNARDWDIFKRFERGNAAVLAAEHQVSVVWIYAIYRRCLAAYRAKVQTSLFAGQEPPAEERSHG